MSKRIDKCTLVGEAGDNRDSFMRFNSAPAKRLAISQPPSGKPSIVIMNNGDVVLSYIGDYSPTAAPPQGEHMCITRSSDGGATWSKPVRATNSPHNDREGYLIHYDDDTLQICYMRVMLNTPQPWQGPFLVESTDGGESWSEPWQVDITDFCPNGPFGCGDRGHIVMPDGTLFLFVSTYETPPQPYEYVMISRDRGRSFDQWHLVSECSGDSSFCLRQDGTLAASLRINADNFPHRDAHPQLRENSEQVHYMGFSESADAGQTWSTASRLTGFNEIPGHMIQLPDGRLMLTFGVRHYPLGIQAVMTQTDGRTWDLDNRLMLAWDGGMVRLPNGYCRHTIGHPYSAVLPDGQIMTAYYRCSDPFDGNTCRVEALIWSAP